MERPATFSHGGCGPTFSRPAKYKQTMNDQQLLAECQRFFAEQAKSRMDSYPLRLNVVILNDASRCRIEREQFNPHELKRYETLAEAGGGKIVTLLGELTGQLTYGPAWSRVKLLRASQPLGLACLVWAEAGWPDFFRRFRCECQRTFLLTRLLPPGPPPASPWLAAMVSPALQESPDEVLRLLWQLSIATMDQAVRQWGKKSVKHITE